VSLHESPLGLFPGTGFAQEVGGDDARGTTINVALPAGTRDGVWLRAFHAIVPPVVRALGHRFLSVSVDVTATGITRWWILS
jgi:acetoin utilization protein AcuC